MSLSQKTLNLDTIIVETLFNRGVPLSTSQTYMPIVSYVGTYVPLPTYTKDILVPISTLVVTSTILVIVSTLASSGSQDIGTNGMFNGPMFTCVDNLSTLYVSDFYNNKIRIINISTGRVTTLAGSDSAGSDDGIGTNAMFNRPSGLSLDTLGTLYVSDSGNSKIRTINISTGRVTTLAGSDLPGSGDGIGTNARFRSPYGLSLDTLGTLYVADFLANRIRTINISTGRVSTLAGSISGSRDGIGTNAMFDRPSGLSLDNLSTLYVSDFNNNKIRTINISTGRVTTLAGSDLVGSGDGIGTNARFINPFALCLDTLGTLYVSDSGNSKIRTINISTGRVSTLAGSDSAGSYDGIGTNATFISPYGLSLDTLGTLYIPDFFANNIRTININTYYNSNYPVSIVNCNIIVKYNITLPKNSLIPYPWPPIIQGNMLTWSYLPVSTIYDSYFYGINPENILNQEKLFESQDIGISTSLQLCVNTITSLSNTTLSTFVDLCNMNSSTISSYTSSLQVDTVLSIKHYNTVDTNYINVSTVTDSMVKTFFPSTFQPNANDILNYGNFYYLKRPVPLPRPIPWYWQGQPTLYVGPSLSSMYNKSIIPNNYNLIKVYYPSVLSNTSTAWTNSNSTIQSSINAYTKLAISKFLSIDTGSSISTVFGYSNSTFVNHLSTEFYGDDVSTISTFVLTYFNSYVIPTDGPYISSGASSLLFVNSTLNSTLLTYISSGILGDPLSTFSTTVSYELTNIINTIYIEQNNITLSTLNSTLVTSLIPVANALSLSTNVIGYQYLSTLYPTMFSSVSTLYSRSIALIIGSNFISTVSTINATLSTYSTNINYQTSSLLALNSQLNAGPGLSSLNLYLSTNISTSYTLYSSQVSSLSTFLQISTVTFQNQLTMAKAYYAAIKPMLFYSTTRYVYPGTGNTIQYQLRSTSFNSIELRSTINLSTLSVSTLGIATDTTVYSFAIKGAANIFQPLNQPSLSLSNINIYATDSIGIVPGNTLVAQLSSIVFNSTFTIKRLYNSTLTGLIGINTANPTYALDIGIGDARKLTGTWINPSDERIKENITSIDYINALHEISSLRLVWYTWVDSYRANHGLDRHETLGFLSQEVEKVFPSAVTMSVEEGYSDFRTLNTDQLMKSKYGLTQHLLHRFSTLQSRINNLF